MIQRITVVFNLSSFVFFPKVQLEAVSYFFLFFWSRMKSEANGWKVQGPMAQRNIFKPF